MKGNIYKFMAGKSFHLDALQNNQIYFAKFAQLNDPYEGLLHFSYEGVTDSLRKTLLANGLAKKNNVDIKRGRQLAEKMIKKKGIQYMRELVKDWTDVFFESYLNHHLEKRFVFSAAKQKELDEFPAPLNNMMMWSHYADGLRGMCVEYDYHCLLRDIEELNEGIELNTREVRYSSKKLPLVLAKTMMEAHMLDDGKAGREMIEAFCTKSDAWAYENEIRFLSSQHELVLHRERSIKRVFVSKNNDVLVQKLVDILRAKDAKVPLYSVQVRPKQYGLGFVPVSY